jgi:hypothetical protein
MNRDSCSSFRTTYHRAREKTQRRCCCEGRQKLLLHEKDMGARTGLISVARHEGTRWATAANGMREGSAGAMCVLGCAHQNHWKTRTSASKIVVSARQQRINVQITKLFVRGQRREKFQTIRICLHPAAECRPKRRQWLERQDWGVDLV